MDTGTFEEDEEVVFDDMVDEFDDEDEAIDAVSHFVSCLLVAHHCHLLSQNRIMSSDIDQPH